MPKQREPVQAYIEDYICDVCGEGKMRNDGFSYDTNPPSYPHKCDKCGNVDKFCKVRYPRIVHEKINQ